MSLDRRSILKGTIGLAGIGIAGQALGERGKLRVAVIGGGIIGTSVALHLAKAGASVQLFEKKTLASGATKNSLAWINPVVNNDQYMRLRLLSMRHWQELDAQLKTGVIWGGSISWTKGDAKGRTLRDKIDLLAQTGEPFKRLPDYHAVEALSPAVKTGGDVSGAVFLPKDGHVDPVYATRQFAAAAGRLGARVYEDHEIVAIERKGNRVLAVRTATERFPVDQVVFVGGTDTPHLMSMLDAPFKLSNAPGLVVHTTPQPIVTRMVYEANGEFEFKQYANGQIVTSFTSGPPDLPQHKEIRAHPMDYPSEDLRQFHGAMLVSRTAEYLPAAAKAEAKEILLGFRPMPLDKLPVVGPVPGQSGCYMIVTHSGVTLAPILGKFAAAEVLDGALASALAPFRPDRFIKPS